MTAYAGNTTTSTPTVASSSSVIILAANALRKCLIIQNNSGADVAIGLEGQALTGIAATATNKCYVLKNTAGLNVLKFTDGFVPAGAITAYQTSGGAINTLVVIEA